MNDALRRYDPSKCAEFATQEHDEEMLDWLDEARTNSDLFLLSGWARERLKAYEQEVADLRVLMVRDEHGCCRVCGR